jgi:hypothetical protein
VKLTNYNGLPLHLPGDPNQLAIEEDPPGSTKITILATGAVFNVQESADEVLRLMKEETKP